MIGNEYSEESPNSTTSVDTPEIILPSWMAFHHHPFQEVPSPEPDSASLLCYFLNSPSRCLLSPHADMLIAFLPTSLFETPLHSQPLEQCLLITGT